MSELPCLSYDGIVNLSDVRTVTAQLNPFRSTPTFFGGNCLELVWYIAFAVLTPLGLPSCFSRQRICCLREVYFACSNNGKLVIDVETQRAPTCRTPHPRSSASTKMGTPLRRRSISLLRVRWTCLGAISRMLLRRPAWQMSSLW